MAGRNGKIDNDHSGLWADRRTEVKHCHWDSKEHTFFILRKPNNPKLESPGLKNISSKFSMERD